MRPTFEQIYCNPHFFVQLLSEAGLDAAQAKVMALYNDLVEFMSIKNYLVCLEEEYTEKHQVFYRSPSLWMTRQKDKTRMIKRVTPARLSKLKYGQYVKKKTAEYNRRIDKWPEVTFDPSVLATKHDQELVKKKRQRRVQRGRRSMHYNIRVSG